MGWKDTGSAPFEGRPTVSPKSRKLLTSTFREECLQLRPGKRSI